MIVGLLVLSGALGGLPSYALAAPALQDPPPADPAPPAPPEVQLPFIPSREDIFGGSSPYSDCLPGFCTIIDFWNPNIPVDVEACIAVDVDGRNVRGRRRHGDTCRPVDDSVNQREIH